jgi:hypothetical protein
MIQVGEERKRLGFGTTFEHAVYELLLEITAEDESFSKKITKRIYQDIKPETEIIGWKTKRDSQKRISLIIYDLLHETKNKHLLQREDMINEISEKIVNLAIEDL